MTTLGEIEAKRVSASPAWPRALVREFHRAGLRPGDVVAASFSGSFPGINLAVMSASEAMGLQLDRRLVSDGLVVGRHRPGLHVA